jgi:hypothetical protein
VDKPAVEKTFEPPLPVRRVFAGIIGVYWIGAFVVHPSLRAALVCLFFCPVAVGMARTPSSLRDGRSAAWEDRHPVLLSVIMAVYAGLGAYLLMSTRLDERLSIELAVPAGLAYGVLLGLVGRRRRSRTTQS